MLAVRGGNRNGDRDATEPRSRSIAASIIAPTSLRSRVLTRAPPPAASSRSAPRSRPIADRLIGHRAVRDVEKPFQARSVLLEEWSGGARRWESEPGVGVEVDAKHSLSFRSGNTRPFPHAASHLSRRGAARSETSTVIERVSDRCQLVGNYLAGFPVVVASVGGLPGAVVDVVDVGGPTREDPGDR